MGFDSLARHYRWMEFVLAGRKLERCRTAFLHRLDVPRDILIAGEGNGRFLAECLRSYPEARVTVVDSSTRMLALARHRVQQLGLGTEDVRFVQGDAASWTPEEGAFDLIVTHFFLDCFWGEKLRRVIANLARAAAPDTVWLIADFQLPPRGCARWRAQMIHALMYAFFRATTGIEARRLTPPDGLLAAEGFALIERHTLEWGLLHSDLWSRVRAPRSDPAAQSAREYGHPRNRSAKGQAVGGKAAMPRPFSWTNPSLKSTSRA